MNFTKPAQYKFAQVCPASGYIHFQATILLHTDHLKYFAPICSFLRNLNFNAATYAILLSKFFKPQQIKVKYQTLALIFGAKTELSLKKIT